jgi:hypothetical protein
MATWPTTLPEAKFSGYQLAPQPQSLRTDMEIGAGRSRRRSYSRNDHVSVSWQMTDAQFTAFRAWFEDDTEAAGGSAWFYITLCVGDTGATSKEARFIGEFQASLSGHLQWAVTAQLEVR